MTNVGKIINLETRFISLEALLLTWKHWFQLESLAITGNKIFENVILKWETRK